MDFRELGVMTVGGAAPDYRRAPPDGRCAARARPTCVLTCILLACVALIVLGYVCYTDGCFLLGV